MSHADGHSNGPQPPKPAGTRGKMEIRPQKPERKRLYLLAGLGLILAGVVLVVGLGWAKARRVQTCVTSTLDGLSAMQEMASAGTLETADLDLVGLGEQLRGLREDLACLRTESGGVLALAPLLGWLPEVGGDVASAPQLLEMAEALTNAGVLVFDAISPVLEGIEAPGSTAQADGQDRLDLAQAVLAMDAAQPALVSAEAELDRAAALQLELEEQALSPRLGRLLDLTGRYLPLLRAGVGAAQLAPELLGADGPRTYLILAQNDDERRPTGGWISGLGLLTVDQGRVSEVHFLDSWMVDNLQVPHEIPPESMLRTLWAEIWLFRDANWSPDFPTAAQVAEDILRRDQGIAVDGAIAVDQRALQLLVAALEPLKVESSSEPVKASNLLTFVRQAWAEPQEGVTLAEGWGEWVAHRKDFMSELAGAMLQRVQEQPETVDLSKLGRSLWQSLQERHILVYLHDPESAALLASQRWDGGIVTEMGDYLQVVDANVGFNKVDPNVRREIAYRVDLADPAHAQAEVVVTYRNESQRTVESCVQEVTSVPSYEQRMQGCLWNYVRFYLPEGIELGDVEREPVPAGSLLARYRFAPLGDAGPDTGPAENGKVAHGLFFALAPGEQREVRLAWHLASDAIEKNGDQVRYRLLVQKQSGTPAIPLRLTVTVPVGTRVLSSAPEPAEVSGEELRYSLSLAADQQIDISFVPSGYVQP